MTEVPHYFILTKDNMKVELEKGKEISRQLEIKRGKPYKPFAPAWDLWNGSSLLNMKIDGTSSQNELILYFEEEKLL